MYPSTIERWGVMHERRGIGQFNGASEGGGAFCRRGHDAASHAGFGHAGFGIVVTTCENGGVDDRNSCDAVHLTRPAARDGSNLATPLDARRGAPTETGGAVASVVDPDIIAALGTMT